MRNVSAKLSDRSTNSVVQIIIGALLIMLGLVLIGVSGWFILLLLGGAVITWYGIKNYDETIRYEKYAELVVNRKLTSIDQIGALMKRTYDECFVELNDMIKKGYLPNYYLREKSRQIIYAQAVSNSSAESGSKSVRCRNCNANNILHAGNDECEYCGTVLRN